MSSNTLQDLMSQARNGSLDRRGFVRRATAAGLAPAAAGTLATSAFAQDATPPASPVGPGETIRSMTRAEYYEQLKNHFPLEEPGATGGQLIHSYTNDIATMNTILASDVYSQMVIGFTFEGLVSENPVDGTIVPSGLADYWEISPDGVTYTFHLNPNARWHDGEPVTANDVVFTIDAIMAEDSPSIRASTVSSALAEWRAVDDLTVELVATFQSAAFLYNTVLLFAILPKHIWEDVPLLEWPSDPGSTGQDVSRVVGSGPFRFVEWVLGDHVTLERNPDYWDQDNVPIIDRYIYNVVADANSQVALLQTGESDLIGVSTTQVDALMESNPEIQIEEVDTGSFTYYLFNQNPEHTDMFTDVRVRQALQYALDRDTFAEVIQGGYAIRADGTQPVLSIAYAPERMNTIYNYDPDRANELLDEAGWTLGDDGIRVKDGTRFSFELTYSESNATYDQGIPFIQQYWREVGVEVIPASMPFPTQLERLDTLDFEAAILPFSWSPDGFQESMFRCDAMPPNGFNWMGYCNPEYDELDNRAQRELDDEKRIDLLIEATNIVHDEAAIGVMTFAKSLYGASPRVRNFFPTGYSGYWWISYAWIEENA